MHGHWRALPLPRLAALFVIRSKLGGTVGSPLPLHQLRCVLVGALLMLPLPAHPFHASQEGQGRRGTDMMRRFDLYRRKSHSFSRTSFAALRRLTTRKSWER